MKYLQKQVDFRILDKNKLISDIIYLKSYDKKIRQLNQDLKYLLSIRNRDSLGNKYYTGVDIKNKIKHSIKVLINDYRYLLNIEGKIGY